jgi:hypothetical protein
MADELKNIETSIIEELAAAFRAPTVDQLIAQGDADVRRMTAEECRHADAERNSRSTPGIVDRGY